MPILSTIYSIDEETAYNPYLAVKKQAECSVDDDPNATTPDYTVLVALINAAESLADSYAGRCFEVPLTSPSAAYIDAIMRIAKCKLVLRRPDLMTDDIREDHDQALAWLQSLCEGTNPSDPPDDSTAASGADEDADDEVFVKQPWG